MNAIIDDDPDEIEISDVDRDSLHILPLRILPLHTKSVARARMIKNARLISVIEMFDDAATGSGQIGIEDLPKEFGWPASPPHHDLLLLRQVGTLTSYDVFSLRITLRDRGILVDGMDGLRLSSRKVQELTTYMSAFTRPLVSKIYGNEDVSVQSFDDIMRLFRSPDLKEARIKLQRMAEYLSVEVADIPRFLENYGDIFLSVSYYRQCLDQIMPSVDSFMRSIQQLESNFSMGQDAVLAETCRMMKATVGQLTAAISGCLENFDRSTKDLWQNLSPERFRNVERMVRSYHAAMGGALCSLSVKVDAWVRRYPSDNVGSMHGRAQFLTSEMRQGFEKMGELELAPMLASLR
jgi:hypothetical protein